MAWRAGEASQALLAALTEPSARQIDCVAMVE
jgi:hypothetical protein